jgi:hypothetical protein
LSNASPGPYVTALFLCERVLREENGVFSAVRIIDYAAEDASVPIPMSEELKTQFYGRPFLTTAWLYVSVFPDAPGAHQMRIRLVYEDGISLTDLAFPIEFKNDSDGVTFAVEIKSPFPKPGRIWIEAWIDEVFKTRSRFTLRRSLREGTAEPSGAAP